MPSIKKSEYDELLLFKKSAVEYQGQVGRLTHERNMLSSDLQEVCRMNEDLRRELYDIRDEVEACRRAVQIERLRYGQFKKMLDTYQNLILDWYNVQTCPPQYITVDKIDIPNCLKPLDSFKYIFRNAGLESTPGTTPLECCGKIPGDCHCLDNYQPGDNPTYTRGPNPAGIIKEK
jgi:hypothetical protein